MKRTGTTTKNPGGGQSVRHIIFDMYGVIIRESKGNFIPYVYRHFPDTERIRLLQLFSKAGIGEITGEEFARAVGFRDGEAVTRDYVENNLTYDAGFAEFADKYRLCFDYALLSNDVSSWSRHLTAFHAIDGYFCEKVVSGDVGMRKPDTAIYRVLLERTGWNPGDCVFIDNSVKNLITANELGMKTVLFNRDGETYNGETIYSFTELEKLAEGYL